jgi:Asp-tRNA(Asn)/Glu-tRNA(Gln) amidotransferase A subunit family amidase
LGANSKLPIGLNVVGPEYSDLLTIDFARLLRTECGFDFVPPPLALATSENPKL